MWNCISKPIIGMEYIFTYYFWECQYNCTQYLYVKSNIIFKTGNCKIIISIRRLITKSVLYVFFMPTSIKGCLKSETFCTQIERSSSTTRPCTST